MLHKCIILSIWFLYFFGSTILMQALPWNLPYSNEIAGKIETCLQAIKNRTQSNISDFYCPQWEMNEASQTITRQKIAYQVAVSVLFSKVDAEAEKTMQLLQENRDEKFENWVNNINTTIQGNATSNTVGIREKYLLVCAEQPGEHGIYGGAARDAVTVWAKSQNPAVILTIDGFPDTACQDLAIKKAKAWENMGYIFAAQGIAKGQQNKKDIYLDKTKTLYSTLLGKFLSYKVLIGNAVDKITGYIKNPVQ